MPPSIARPHTTARSLRRFLRPQSCCGHAGAMAPAAAAAAAAAAPATVHFLTTNRPLSSCSSLAHFFSLRQQQRRPMPQSPAATAASPFPMPHSLLGRRGLASGSGGSKPNNDSEDKSEPTVVVAEASQPREQEVGGEESMAGQGAGMRLGDVPGVHYADRRLAIVYTCKVCGTRAAKAFSKRAYDHGVVIVRCPGCDNLHLVADRLGWFEDGSWDVSRVLKEQGENVVAVNDDNVLSLTPKDLIGGGKGEGEDKGGGEGSAK